MPQSRGKTNKLLEPACLSADLDCDSGDLCFAICGGASCGRLAGLQSSTRGKELLGHCAAVRASDGPRNDWALGGTVLYRRDSACLGAALDWIDVASGASESALKRFSLLGSSGLAWSAKHIRLGVIRDPAPLVGDSTCATSIDWAGEAYDRAPIRPEG